MSSSSLGRAENRGRRRLFSPTLPTPFFSETTKNTPTKLPTCLPHGGRREDALLRRLHSGRPGHPTPLAGVLGVFPPSVFTYKYREGQQQEKKRRENKKKNRKKQRRKRRRREGKQREIEKKIERRRTIANHQRHLLLLLLRLLLHYSRCMWTVERPAAKPKMVGPGSDQLKKSKIVIFSHFVFLLNFA